MSVQSAQRAVNSASEDLRQARVEVMAGTLASAAEAELAYEAAVLKEEVKIDSRTDELTRGLLVIDSRL